MKRWTRWNTSDYGETGRVLPGAQARFAGPAETARFRHRDELISVPKSALTHYVGSLKATALRELSGALAVSLGIEDLDPLGFGVN